MTAVLPGATGTRTTTRLKIPGVGTIETTRDRASGSLLSIIGETPGGLRVPYLSNEGDGATWHGVCHVRESREDDEMVRRVTTDGDAWTERYSWRSGQLVHVDGVEVRRDAAGRVVACHDQHSDARWLYTLSDGVPVRIEGPGFVRTIALGDRGRVHSWQQDGVITRLAYDADGRRRRPARPWRDHVDEAGRCWAEVDSDGTVRRVYLWDGSRCLARIDGSVGDPLGAVFSLDPSGTPVRVITPAGSTRVPRDAYGEGLLRLPGVPGLFGGQVVGGIVHLPLRRLDPRTATFLEPDPLDGSDDDPRRGRDAAYQGPLPVERDPGTDYQVCRGDPIGRADPTGGVSAGLVVSTLTWSFQNNVLTFFGIDWWFNLIVSLVTWPGTGVGPFGSEGISASDRRGGFGIRRDGIIDVITGGRAFTTQHLVWMPDSEQEELQRGEVFAPAARFEPTHYGTILSLTPQGKPRTLLAGMDHNNAAIRRWAARGVLNQWTRHGGVGEPVAPGSQRPWFPHGGFHLDMTLTNTRHDVSSTLAELGPGAVGAGELSLHTTLTAFSRTGFAAGDRLLLTDSVGTPPALTLVDVAGVVPLDTAEQVQLTTQVAGFAATGLTATKVAATPSSSESRGAGAVANSLDLRGTAVTYAPADLLRIVASTGEVTVARADRLSARLPIERPLPAALATPFEVRRGAVGAGQPVTIAGGNVDFGAGARPAPTTTGLLSGGGAQVAVRIETHVGATAATVDAPIPAAISGAASISFAPVTGAAVLGSGSAVDAAAQMEYVPAVAGTAPDGAAGLQVVHVTGAGQSHARVVSGAPVHDVVIVDRPFAGTGPFTIERIAVQAPTAGQLVLRDLLGLIVADPAPFASAPAVFLSRVNGSPPTAGTSQLTGVDVVGGVITTTWSGTAPALGVGEPVLAGARPAVVRALRVTVTLDRSVSLGSAGLKVVGLQATGPTYRGTATSGTEVVVEPSIDVGGTAVDWPFFRALPGDLVSVRTGGTTTAYRVDSVNGGVLTLTGGPAMTAGPATVRRLDVTEPGTGSPYLGLNGGQSGADTTVDVDVWTVGVLASGTLIGIVEGGVTHPAAVTGAAQALRVSFSEAFDAPGISVSSLTSGVQAFATTLTRTGATLILDPATAMLPGLVGPGATVLVVAYTETGASVGGVVGPGTTLVPESEATEIDRAQSLIDHELEHTLQYSKWGPLWFNAFPMLAMELPGILATDTELPDYSPSMAATVATGEGGRWALTIPNRGSTSLSVNDDLQLIAGSRRATVKIRAIDGTTYQVTTDDGALPMGAVSVRKQQNSTVFDVFFSIFDLLTHGGLVNVLAGSTWGGLFWLIGKGVYGIYRAIAGTGDLHAATVTDGSTITMDDDAGRAAIRATGRVTIRRGDDTVIRSMVNASGVLTVQPPVSFTGGVQVAMYDTHNPGDHFDWYDYTSATIDAANPARLTLDAPASFSPNDRVQLRYRSRDFKDDVTAVSGQVVELASAVTLQDGELSIRIAKVGHHDPLGNADSAAMVEMGMGWMKWIFDPYGQIEYAVDPSAEWARWLLRVMRWVLGTQNFSLLPFGYLWWGRLFPIREEYRAEIEQQASEQSGDLYSPVGRLTGEVSGSAFGARSMVVGDIARYRYFPDDRTDSFVSPRNDPTSTRRGGRLDAPGVWLRQDLRVMADRTGGATSADPNLDNQMDATREPGRAVAEIFTNRDADPRAIATNGLPPAPDPLGYAMSDLGCVPTSARNQRTLGGYVAFTREGSHRVTTVNGIPGDSKVADLVSDERQPLYFEVAATDVTVVAAGQTLANGDTVTLVPFQRADVVTTPDTSRVYRLTVADPSGPVVALDGNRLVGVGAGTGVVVEVSRFYAVTGAGAFGPGGLAAYGLHTSRPIDIAVRRFSADVVTTLSLRDAPARTATTLTSLARGTDAFLLVPAPIARAPRVSLIGGAPPTAAAVLPTIARVDTPAAELGFVTTAGAVFSVNFPAGAATGPVELSVNVGPNLGAAAVLTCQVDVT
jgi:large repetitive protein